MGYCEISKFAIDANHQ